MYKLTISTKTVKELKEIISKISGEEEQKEIKLVRETPIRKSKQWTQYENSLLLSWYSKGYKAKRIADSLQRTISAVNGRINMFKKRGLLKNRNNVTINL